MQALRVFDSEIEESGRENHKCCRSEAQQELGRRWIFRLKGKDEAQRDDHQQNNIEWPHDAADGSPRDSFLGYTKQFTEKPKDHPRPQNPSEITRPPPPKFPEVFRVIRGEAKTPADQV
jgi:hypothetical protein